MNYLRNLIQFLVVAIFIGGATAGIINDIVGPLLKVEREFTINSTAKILDGVVQDAKAYGIINDTTPVFCEIAKLASKDSIDCNVKAPPVPPKKWVGENCPLYSKPEPARVFGNGRIIDISHQIRAGLPSYGSTKLTGTEYLELWFPFEEGKTNDFTQNLGLHIPSHTSTHVDAPSHAIVERQRSCCGVDQLDLDILVGRALLVDVPRDKNITAETLKELNLPSDIRRVLFRTANTDRELMWKPFESNYTGFTVDGAQWLVNNTNIQLVGIDYMSISIGSHKEDIVPPHKVLLEKNVIPVEALNLGGVAPGEYDLSCLPIKLLGGDGAPARCILIKTE